MGSLGHKHSTPVFAHRSGLNRAGLSLRMIDSASKSGSSTVPAGELQDRANAHGVGLLQEPFGPHGKSGAFACIPEHAKDLADLPGILDPWEGNKFPEGCTEDPFGLVKEEINPFADSIKAVLATDHPVLEQARFLFFRLSALP